VRDGLTQLFSLPDGWEVVLGNGGSTVFWDVATFGLIAERSQHLVFGEFSSKFAEAAAAAPHLGEPTVVRSDPGTHPDAAAEDGIDLYALTHNETSTGVAMELRRPAGTSADTALVASTRPPPPAACAGTPLRSTCTTSLPRSASPPTAGSGSPPAHRRRSSASSRSAPATGGVRPRST
jgi:predicted phosphoserine aminotransferase